MVQKWRDSLHEYAAIECLEDVFNLEDMEWTTMVNHDVEVFFYHSVADQPVGTGLSDDIENVTRRG